MKSVRPFIFALVMGIVVAAVFGQILSFDFVTYDDDLFVLHPAVSGWGGLDWTTRLATPHIGYPIPLTLGIHAALYALVDFSAAWFHGLSLSFHLLVALLVWRVGESLGIQRRWAVVATLFWALHPLNAETVAWATSLKEQVMTLGLLLVVMGAVAGMSGRRWAWLLAAAGAMIAIGGKPTGVVAGPLLLATIIAQSKRGQSRAPRGPLALGAALTIFGLAWSYLAFGMHSSFGGQGSFGGLTPFCESLYLQLQHVVVPLTLGPRYGSSGSPLLACLVTAGAVAAGVWLAKWGWDRRRADVVVGLSLALGAWLPVSNLIPLDRFTADSYMYAPLIGLTWAVTAALSERGAALTRRGMASACLVLTILAVGTFFQTTHWRNGITLWDRALVTAPEHDHPFVKMKIGQSFALYERWPQAVAAFEATDTSLYGTVLPFPFRWPLAHEKLGNIDRARELYRLGWERSRGAPERERQALLDQYQAFVRAHGASAPSP